MPLLGFGAATLCVLSGMPDTLAFGFVIVGCAPGAKASNVIVYFAVWCIVTAASASAFLRRRRATAGLVPSS